LKEEKKPRKEKLSLILKKTNKKREDVSPKGIVVS